MPTVKKCKSQLVEKQNKKGISSSYVPFPIKFHKAESLENSIGKVYFS